LIIGVGSLGGFFAEFISHLPGLQKLTFIDNDSVEESNLKNSIYRVKDLKRKKVYSLYNMIKSNTDDLNIEGIYKKFYESTCDRTRYDMVFDCRDENCDRRGYIDGRFYISFNNLVIDCNKYVTYGTSKQGAYTDDLSKDEIKEAAFKLYKYVRTGKIKKLIEKGIKHIIDLNIDDDDNKLQIAIKKYENQPDLIYDSSFEGEEKLTGHFENLPIILKANKDTSIPIYVGRKGDSFYSDLIPKHELQSPEDVLRILSDMVNNVLTYREYLVKIGGNEERICIELIPESGGA
jgi:hypothetical protein